MNKPALLNKVFIKLFFVIIIFFSFNCTTTVTKIKDPVFNTALNIVSDSLKEIVTGEHYNLDGKDVIINGKSSSVLEITIVNGQNIPDDDNGMIKLGKSIATLLKKSLKDENEYDSYTVIFSTEIKDGITTKTHWKAKYFNSKDL